MIKKPTDKTNPRKHFLMINGFPGIGKSTLALSAPYVLFVDCDNNIDKVSIEHRTADFIDTRSFSEMVNDLRNSDLSEYKTIVFDTGGAMIGMLKAELLKSPSNRRKDGGLKLQSYGIMKRQFEELIDFCMLTIQKHIIIVNHIVERTEQESTVYRIDVEGSSGKYMWQKAELGAMMYSFQGKTILDFSQGGNHFAKGGYGISGLVEIPRLKPGDPNNFVEKLFEQIDSTIEKEGELIEVYNDLMTSVRGLIDSAENGDSLDEILEQFSGFKWVFSSKREAQTLLKRKAHDLGFKYNATTKHFEGDDECTVI